MTKQSSLFKKIDCHAPKSRSQRQKEMKQCEKCGKGLMRGLQVSHAKNRSKKIYKPNLHVFKGGLYCTKCLRRVKEESASSFAKAAEGKKLKIIAKK